ELLHQFAQFLREVPAHTAHLLQQILVFQNRQILQRDATSERASAERSAVLAGRDVLRELLPCQKRAHWQSRRHRLGDADYVGHYAEVLKGKELPGAPHAALNLVEDESGLVLIGHLATGAQEFRGRLLNSALTL